MYVTITLLSVLFLLGFLPIKFALEYDATGFEGCLRILFLKKFFPQKKEKSIKKKPKSPKETRRGNLKDLLDIIEPASAALGKLLRMLRIKKLVCDMNLAGKDAFETAMLYGGTAAAFGCFFPFIDSNFRIKKKSISIKPDFAASETSVYFYADIRILIWQLAVIAVYFLYKLLKKVLKAQKKGNEKNG